MTLRETAVRYQMEILLLAILVFSGFLNFWNVWNQGWSNTYYAAAVRSMLENPVAGFFNSFDPAGFITIDKPPVGLWVQAAFAAVLGYRDWVLVLPQALAGVASVALLFVIVSRPFGKPAGLVAALALALTPIFVAICRNGTMDSQLIFVLLLAVWAVLKAVRERSVAWLLVSAALVGIGFNIKMIQAFIVVPAILAVWILGATDLAWRKRVLHACLAVVVLLAVSLSWAVVVDLVPADQRPFIGGSGDNTVLGLIIEYNGLHRLGLGSGTGGGPGISGGMGPAMDQGNRTTGSPGPAGAGPGTSVSTSGDPDSGPGNAPGGRPPSGGFLTGPAGSQQPGPAGVTGASPGGMGGGGGMNSGGSPGIFRLYGEGLAGDISWLLAFALIGVLAWVRRPKELSPTGLESVGMSGEKGLVLAAMLLWLVPGLLYFSFTSGFWHDYYIATIAPPLAALVGIGAAGMYREYTGGSRAGWLLVAAVLVTGLVQAFILSYNADFAGLLIPVVLLATLAGTGLLAGLLAGRMPGLAGHRVHIVAIAIGILFLAPLAWSFTPMMNGNGGNIPSAGPQGSRGGMNGGMPGGSDLSGMAGPGTMAFSGAGNGSLPPDTAGWSRPDGAMNRTLRSGTGTGPAGDRAPGFAAMPGGSQGTGMGGGEASDSRLTEYLLSHASGETWILAVSGSQSGAGLIIGTGKPVMCLGGFTGSDNVLNITMLRKYIDEGKVRYFLGSGSGSGGGPGGNSALFSWVSQNCAEVPAEDYGGSSANSSADSPALAGGLTSGNTSLSGLPGSGSASGRGTAGFGGAETLYDCRGYSGQTSA